jgi:hypothetical protein
MEGTTVMQTARQKDIKERTKGDRKEGTYKGSQIERKAEKKEHRQEGSTQKGR